MLDGLVSIVTPMHNAVNTIALTIQSVQKQTYENWEMIIVDDCSSDESVQIAKNYAEEDTRIIVISNPTNMGVAKTRNFAIEHAKGQYIAFLDSDDLWRPNKLDIQLALMKEKECPFCFGMCAVIDASGVDLDKNRSVPAEIKYEELLKGNPIPCLTVVIDRTKIDKIEMPMVPHEDYLAWLTILRDYDITACGVQSVIADYRIGNSSVSSNKLKAAKWTWDIYRSHLKLSFFKSVKCFMFYIVRAVMKRK